MRKLVLLVLLSITLITFDVRGSGIIDGARRAIADAAEALKVALTR